MDVMSTFLNGIIEEEVYVHQRPSYEVEGYEHKVYLLKQTPRAWYNRIDSYLISNGFTISESVPTLYTK